MQKFRAWDKKYKEFLYVRLEKDGWKIMEENIHETN
jgi:hypothetical protein